MGRSNPIRNVLLNGLRLIISLLASIIASGLIVRHLGPDNTGLYAYILWLSGILVAISHLGLPTSATKYVAESIARNEKWNASRIIQMHLWLQGASTLAVMLVGGLVVHSFLQLKGGLLWIALMLVFPQALQQTLSAALVGAQRYRELTWIASCGSVSQIFLILVVAQVHNTLFGFLAALVIANTVQSLLAYWLVSRHLLQVKIQDTSSTLPRPQNILGFAGTVYYLVLLDMVVWQRSELYFLKRYSSLEQIAFYSIAFLMVSKLGDVVVSMTSILLPMQTEGLISEGVVKTSAIQSKALRSIHLALAPLIGAAAVLAHPAILILYGTPYLVVVPLFLIMLISPVAQAFTDVGVAITYASGKERSLLLPLSLTMLLNVGLAVLLVPRFAALGAVVANCVAQTVEAIFLIRITSVLLPLYIPWAKILKTYSIAAIAFLPAWVLSRLTSKAPVAVGVAILGAILYFGMLLLLKEIDPADWTIVREALSGKIHVSTA